MRLEELQERLDAGVSEQARDHPHCVFLRLTRDHRVLTEQGEDLRHHQPQEGDGYAREEESGDGPVGVHGDFVVLLCSVGLSAYSFQSARQSELLRMNHVEFSRKLNIFIYKFIKKYLLTS